MTNSVYICQSAQAQYEPVHPYRTHIRIIIIIIIEGLSLLQSIPPTTANKQTRAQMQWGSRARKLLGANAKTHIRISSNNNNKRPLTPKSMPPASYW